MSVTEGGTGAADDRPLTQQEYQQVQRLFSDPFSFPIQFKTWLVSYLESSDLNLPFSAVNGLVQVLGITGVGAGALGVLPPGLVLPYAGMSAPTGSLLCDGTAYLISNYQRLWDAIKSSGFGQPDASSFYVPDLRGRVPAGAGPHGDVPMAANEGLPAGSRSPRHNTAAALSGSNDGSTSTGASGYLVLTDHGPAATVHGSLPGPRPEDTPAYQTLNFIIVA